MDQAVIQRADSGHFPRLEARPIENAPRSYVRKSNGVRAVKPDAPSVVQIVEANPDMLGTVRNIDLCIRLQKLIVESLN